MILETEVLNRFGHSGFRAGQKELIEAVLSGKDAMGVMPTGGGKSLCFQLPAALLEGTALVVSPLIALMKDQVDALRARGIHAEAYNSTQSFEERRKTRDGVREGRVRLLYMAPERMQQNDFMELLSNTPLSFLAIDEAHCISHWGHDFRPDYRKLGDLRRFLRGPDPSKPVPVIALTATATRRVQVDIVERLGMKNPVQVITGFRRTNLAFEVVPCGGRAEKFRHLKSLMSEATAAGGSTVIYAATRKNVELVAEELKDPRVSYYHAGLGDAARVTAQEDFLTGRKPVLVATNAFGMGIDKSNVRVVAHYDIPGSVEAYYQEAGRAGRDGKPARCTLLFNYADVATQDFFIKKTSTEILGEGENSAELAAHIQSQQALLKQLVRYAYSNECRQKIMLDYFGDPEARKFSGCGNCDRCAPKTVEKLAVDEWTSLACQQALTAVGSVNGRFGKSRICEILKGSDTAGIRAAGLQTLAAYGVLSDWSMVEIRELADLLIEADLLRITGLDYPVLSLSSQGIQAAKREIPILLPKALKHGSHPHGASGTTPKKLTSSSRSKSSLGLTRSSHSTSSAGLTRSNSDSKNSSRDSKNSSETDLPESAQAQALFARLKSFRKTEAEKKKVPSYVVFHDKTLKEITYRAPRTLDELQQIPGLGPKKIELYGEQILGMVAEFSSKAV